MKNNKLHLVAKGGLVESFKNKEEAFEMLGSDFIKKYVGFELRVLNYDSYNTRRFLQETSSYINNKWMNDGKKRYGEVFKDLFPYYEHLSYYGSYMLINDFNQKFCIVDFKDLLIHERRTQKSNSYSDRKKKFWNGNGSVPGTGVRNSKAGWSNTVYKRPKTISGLRSSFDVFDDEYDIQEPSVRNKMKLVIRDVWDEIPRTDCKINNWKRYRKQQYK